MAGSHFSSAWKLAVLILAFLLLPIFSNYYKYYVTKNFIYAVEAKCDPLIEVCFMRDCTVSDDCPSNGFSKYKKYYVKASDFSKCSDNSCQKECENGLIQCRLIHCGDSEDDVCTTPHI